MSQQTISIIKPDAVGKNVIGKIYDRFESAGLKIVAAKMLHLSQEQAEGFYAVHKERPFFNNLVSFMCSGPCMVMELRKDNAVSEWRNLIGATDPDQAEEGTIRKLFADSKERNSVHGSDSDENAMIEINYFFKND